MNVKTSELNQWRSCFGLCVICGQVMGIKTVQKSDDGTAIVENEQGKGIREALLLTEECPIRQVFTGHNFLGDRQVCHVLDQYTFLKKPNPTLNFRQMFELYQAQILAVNGDFASLLSEIQKPTSETLDMATATCKRVAGTTTVSGCALCNKAMAKDIMHINAVYRCFSLTKDADVPSLEENTVTAIAIKKVIQQIAFYFQPPPTIGKGVWRAKPANQLLLDGALWRCIAHLCAWGQTGMFRSRVIAVFHASHYIYLISGFQETLSFEDWHIHLFRDYYMHTFSNSNQFCNSDTWFGMHQLEVAACFDLSRKRGDYWASLVKSRLSMFAENMAIDRDGENMIVISDFKAQLLKYVNNERSLLQFVSRKDGIERGLQRLLLFFKYNIGAPSEAILIKRCEVFEKNMCRAFRRLPKTLLA